MPLGSSFLLSFSVIHLWAWLHFLVMSSPLCSIYCWLLSFGFLHIKLTFVFFLCLCPNSLGLLHSLFFVVVTWSYHSLYFQWLFFSKRIALMILALLGTLFCPPDIASPIIFLHFQLIFISRIIFVLYFLNPSTWHQIFSLHLPPT